MKMGTYIIQKDFTTEEARSVVKRIWETILSGEYDDSEMKEFVSESQENLLKIIKTTASSENYILVRLYEDLVYCKRRLEI